MKPASCGLAFACALFTVACSGEERPPAEPAPVAPDAPAPAAEPAPAPEPAAAELEPTPEEVPVREDFEDEVATEVTLANYRAELDRLEKAIEERN